MSLREQAMHECASMTRYALESGITVPPGAIRVIERELARADKTNPSDAGFEDLVKAHDVLSGLVSPATPRTILLLSQHTQSRLAPLGPVRFIRQMLVVVLVLLVAFVLLATSDDINSNSGDVFNSSGTELLLNELFFLAAGGMGAAFAALFTAHRFIAAGTYDPKYESTYWIQFILGLMAGLMLPALIPIDGGAESGNLTKPLLALVGGFSASVLYRILDRLVTTVDSLVRGDTREIDAAERSSESLRLSHRATEERLGLAAQLVRLRERANAGMGQAEVATELEGIVQELLPASSAADDLWSTDPAAPLPAEQSGEKALPTNGQGATSGGLRAEPADNGPKG